MKYGVPTKTSCWQDSWRQTGSLFRKLSVRKRIRRRRREEDEEEERDEERKKEEEENEKNKKKKISDQHNKLETTHFTFFKSIEELYIEELIFGENLTGNLAASFHRQMFRKKHIHEKTR